MKARLAALLIIRGVWIMMPSVGLAQDSAHLLHTRGDYVFTVQASIDTLWPLLGANAERRWAPGWNPNFLYPHDATDQQGMVFTLAHGSETAIWINTCLDQSSGRAQYAYVIPATIATLITIQIRPSGAATHVEVVYERTALNEAANTVVRTMTQNDQNSVPAWATQIESYLADSQLSASKGQRQP